MKKMLSCLLMLAMFLTLGWGGLALADVPAERVGTYEIEEFYLDGENYTEAMKAAGLSFTLVLNADGTASLDGSNMEETLAFRWDAERFTYDSGIQSPYDYKDGVITLEEDDTTMVFRKLSGEAEETREAKAPADITGTWVGVVDMRNVLTDSSDELAAYLNVAPMAVTLEMEGDGSYTLRLDASPALDAMKDALRDYIKAYCAENNMTEEQFAASAGMSVEELVERSLENVDMSGATQTMSGRYVEKDGAVVWDPGANALYGLYTGDYLSFSVEDFGDVLLTRQKLDGVWMAKVDLREGMIEAVPELEEVLESANMNLYLVLQEDGSYELTMDGSSLLPAFRDAIYSYLERMCEENGISIDNVAELTGKDAEAILDEVAASLSLEDLTETYKGSYTEDQGAFVLDPDRNPTEGSYNGLFITLDMGDLGKLVFTRSSFLGVWSGYLDVTEDFTAGDAELERYLKDVKLGVSMELKADGSYSLALDPRPMMSSLHSGMRAYLEDSAVAQGLTPEQLEAQLGKSLDEYIDEYLSEMGMDALKMEEEGGYTVKNGAILFADEGGFFDSGMWFGTSMIVTMEDVGDAVLTRR